MWDPIISLPGDPTFNLGSKIPQGGKAKKKKKKKEKEKRRGVSEGASEGNSRKSTELLKLNNSICNMNRKILKTEFSIMPLLFFAIKAVFLASFLFDDT